MRNHTLFTPQTRNIFSMGRELADLDPTVYSYAIGDSKMDYTAKLHDTITRAGKTTRGVTVYWRQQSVHVLYWSQCTVRTRSCHHELKQTLSTVYTSSMTTTYTVDTFALQN